MYLKNYRKLPRHLRPFTRKTARVQSRPDPLEVTATFVLPSLLWGAISVGPAGHHGVEVLPGGVVQVKARGVTRALEAARSYLESVSAQRTLRPITLTVRRSDKPTWQRSYDLHVIDGDVTIPNAPGKAFRKAA